MVCNSTGGELKEGVDFLDNFLPLSIRESNRVAFTVLKETDKVDKNGKIAALYPIWMPRNAERR